MLDFNTNADLIACGIDSEHCGRFSKWGADRAKPSPIIFSQKEIEHCFTLSDPSQGLCASFCCKEAVLKACGDSYNLNTCELFWNPSQKKYHISLSEKFCKEYQIQESIAEVKMSSEGECIVVVFLLG